MTMYRSPVRPVRWRSECRVVNLLGPDAPSEGDLRPSTLGREAIRGGAWVRLERLEQGDFETTWGRSR